MPITSYGSLEDVSGRLLDRLVGASGSVFQGAKVVPAFVPVGTSANIVPCAAPGQAAFLTARSLDLASGSSYASGLDGLPFKLKLAGRVVTTATTTVTLALAQTASPTLTVASTNVIATLFAASIASAKATFYYEARLIWDSSLQDLNGIWEGWLDNGGAAATVANSGALTGITHQSIASAGALNFELQLTSSVASKATLSLSEFRLEML